MLKTLKNAFKIKDLRDKILFTFAMLVVIRIGSQLPVPGVNGEYFRSWFAAQSDGAFSFFDAVTGGSFINMSILALNITPYITSSCSCLRLRFQSWKKCSVTVRMAGRKLLPLPDM